MTLRVGSWPGYGERQNPFHNPFISLFLDGLVAAGAFVTSFERIADLPSAEVDVLVLHWPERVFLEAGGRVDLLRQIAALLGHLRRERRRMLTVWLVHNLVPHDPRRLPRLLWPFYAHALARQVNAALTLSSGTVAPVRAAMPALGCKPVLPLRHPAYPGARMAEAERAAARAERGWRATHRVLGYCGQLRPYKGVEEIIAAFQQIESQDQRLLLAGPVRDSALRDRLERAASADTRIRLEAGALPPEAFRAALNSCDLFLAPLRRYLHSGSIVHALSAARPVLTPRTPFAEVLRSELGDEWVRLYDGPLTGARLESEARARPSSGAPDLSTYAHERIGIEAVAIFEDLLGGRRRAGPAVHA